MPPTTDIEAASDALEGELAVGDALEPRRLTRHGQDRKAELLLHAEALFAERGYADTRMVDIAEAAGVAKGLFYWYFASKEALFSEIILDLRDRLRAAQRVAVTGVEGPLEQIYDGTVASVRFIAENARLYGLIATVARSSSFAADYSRSSDDHARDTGAAMAEGQRLGVIRSNDDPINMAQSNAGVVGQVVSSWSNRAFGGSLDAAAHHAARYVTYAIAASTEVADRIVETRGLGANPRKAKPRARV